MCCLNMHFHISQAALSGVLFWVLHHARVSAGDEIARRGHNIGEMHALDGIAAQILSIHPHPPDFIGLLSARQRHTHREVIYSAPI